MSHITFNLLHSDGKTPVVVGQKSTEAEEGGPLTELVDVAVIHAALIAISGNSSNKPLRDLGITRFNAVETNAQTMVDMVKLLVEKGLCTDEQAPLLLSTIPESLDGEMGCLYGEAWRSFPRHNELHVLTANARSYEDLPSAFRARVAEEWLKVPPEVQKDYRDCEQWASVVYSSSYDQLHEAILNLKAGDKHAMIFNYCPSTVPIHGLPTGTGSQITGINFVPDDASFSFIVTSDGFNSSLDCTVILADWKAEAFEWYLPFYSTLVNLVARQLEILPGTLSFFSPVGCGFTERKTLWNSFTVKPTLEEKDIYQLDISDISTATIPA